MTLEEMRSIVLAFCDESHRFASDALTKYVHKYDVFQTELSIDEVHQFIQKIDIVRGLLNGSK